MLKSRLPRPVIALLALIMLVAGGLLASQVISERPTVLRSQEASVSPPPEPTIATVQESAPNTLTTTISTTQTTRVFSPTVSAATRLTLTLAITNGLPSSFLAAVTAALPAQTSMMTVAHDSPTATLRFGWDSSLGRPIYTQTFAAAGRFDIINPVISWADLQRMWQGEALTYT